MKITSKTIRNRTSRSRGRWCRGAPLRLGVATVEFAIVAPLFFMLVLGCIELGRALMVQQILTNASRVGARSAITLAGSESQAVDAASDFATGASVDGITVNVSPDPATATAGDMITVSVSVPYANVTWVPSPWFLGEVNLTANSVMRKEGFE